MASLNKVMLIGNLTRDPEVRYTPKGTAVTDLGLAMNRYFSGENGERREETTFVDVTLWGKQAELAKEYLTKGRPVFIEGRLQLDTWDDKTTGQQRSRLKVVGETMQFLGSRNDGQRSGGGSSGGSGGGGNYGGGSDASYEASPPPAQSPPSQPSGGGGAPDEEDDDIPF